MEAYIAAILNSIKDGQDIKQVPPAAFFNRTEEEVIANMEETESRMSSEHLKKKTCAPSAEEVGLVLNLRIVHNNLVAFECFRGMTLSNFIFLRV